MPFWWSGRHAMPLTNHRTQQIIFKCATKMYIFYVDCCADVVHIDLVEMTQYYCIYDIRWKGKMGQPESELHLTKCPTKKKEANIEKQPNKHFRFIFICCWVLIYRWHEICWSVKSETKNGIQSWCCCYAGAGLCKMNGVIKCNRHGHFVTHSHTHTHAATTSPWRKKP